MSSDCSRFNQSIDPTNIKNVQVRSDVLALFECLKLDSTEYRGTLTNLADKFKWHYDEILKRISSNPIHCKSFSETTGKFYELSEIKSQTFRVPILMLFDEYQKNCDHRKFLCEQKIGKTFPISQEEISLLDLEQKKAVEITLFELQEIHRDFMNRLSGCVHDAFFSFEHSCRIICYHICFKMAKEIATNLTIQHKEIWKTLKMLNGEKSNVSCSICVLLDSCRFDFDFRLLANIYAYAIHVRMLWDYSKMLFEDETLWKELIDTYFSELENIIITQRSIISRCKVGGS